MEKVKKRKERHLAGEIILEEDETDGLVKEMPKSNAQHVDEDLC